MQIIVCHPNDLSSDDYNACMSLNYRSYGDLRYWLPKSKKIDGARVILAKEDGRVVGWGIVKPYHEKHYRYGQYEVGFYVRQSHRRRGIGTMLLNKAKTVGTLDVRPYNKHDDRAKAFFEKAGY